MHDLVIRGGTIVDGSGGARFSGDVAIAGGRIVEVGAVSGRGKRELDARGLLVTPGWVDVHTHYDGQATWDSLISPSCWHGVTTAVIGNCGVGFAPVKPGTHDYLIKLMEGVEDIPGTVLWEGVQWAWESFPEYLDALASKPRAIDIAAQVPHAALRFYVMGERGADHTEAPTPAEIDAMGVLARDAVRAGALGFTTSRTKNHRASDGRYTPSLTAPKDELVGIARRMGEAGKGVFEIVSDFAGRDAEWEMFREMIRVSGRTASLSLAQADQSPESFRGALAQLDAANAAGLPFKAQVPARAIGVMLGFEASLNPFCGHPSWQELAKLAPKERLAKLRSPEVRARLLGEKSAAPGLAVLVCAFDKIFRSGDYEPTAEQSCAAEAKRRGVAPEVVAYDWLLEDEGRALLYRPLLNYANYCLDATHEMLQHPHVVPGLGDGGAHVGLISDGSFPTFLISHWAKDRTRGPKLPLEKLVKAQSADTAALVGLTDRGRIAVGMKADVNVIDFDALGVTKPEIAYDLPTGGKRLIQRARGYVATVCSGAVTFERGESTGELPGVLVRS
ncbi:MAG: amidohydrolase family protein [Deltaproteobacteria bacterium]|nr:amidohydrolase family protein [Deltaproteobacteria bacterium]